MQNVQFLYVTRGVTPPSNHWTLNGKRLNEGKVKYKTSGKDVRLNKTYIQTNINVEEVIWEINRIG
jgi:hypothetical protein